jgi:hypothetical protein
MEAFFIDEEGFLQEEPIAHKRRICYLIYYY